MNILITGFSGNLGKAVVEILSEQGHNLRLLLHGTAIKRKNAVFDGEVIWGSLKDETILDATTEGVDVVIHCAWDGRGAFEGNFERTNLKGTMKLIEYAQKNSVKTFIHISSVGVYGLNKSLWGKTLDENSVFVSKEDSMNPYPFVKVLIEQEIINKKGGYNMNMIIIRPGLLFNEEKSPAKKVIEKKNKVIAFFIGNAKNHLPYIHTTDVADMVLKIIENPPKFDIFNAVPTQQLPAKEFVKKWALPKKATVIKIPPFCIRIAKYIIGKLKTTIGKKDLPIVKYQITTGVRDIRYSAAKAEKILNWQDKITSEIASR